MKDLVIEEVYNIKKYATEEEIAKLDFHKMEPNETSSCIYGQMTGYCRSNRAVELLNLCTKPFSVCIDKLYSQDLATNFREQLIDAYTAFSPLEFHIYDNKQGARNIVKFLKDEIQELTPDML